MPLLLLPRASSHMRLRARDTSTSSSTLIGGKCGAGPCSLHTTLEGPMEYSCECKMDVKVYMDSDMASNGSRFMITWTIFEKPPLGGRHNRLPGEPWHFECSQPLIILFYHV